MKHDQVRLQESDSSNAAMPPDPEVLRLRTVHRAAADLRRGIPVLLTGSVPLLLLAAETAGPRGIAEFAALTAEPRALLLAPMRAAAVLHQPVDQAAPAIALRIDAPLLAPEPLRGLADPTIDQVLPLQPEQIAAPDLAQTAVMLAKLGRILPAVL